MSRKPIYLPDEVKDAIVRDYQAGVKTKVIQWGHKVTPGTMYRILHAHQVKLRSDHRALFVVRVRDLVARAENMTRAASYDELLKILVECMEGDPLGTITVLIPGGETFTPDTVLRAAEEYFITQVLRSMPNAEYMGDGMWRAKGGQRLES